MDIAGVKCVMKNDTLIAVIEGDIDHHTSRYIRDEIDRAIFYYKPKNAMMELSSVTFMDSSGLGLILGRYTQIVRLGGHFKLLNPTPQIEKILLLAGADKLIPTEKNMEVQKI